MTGFDWLLTLIAVLVLAGVGLHAIGSMHWSADMQQLADELAAGPSPQPSHSMATPAAAKRYDANEIEGLPAPVQRYFRAALTPGQAIVSGATIQMAGRFNLSATREQWKPFTSRQRVNTQRRGFFWDARITMLPGLTVRVVDSYVGGNGWLKASVLGLFTVAELRGGGEIARGEFMRYFAEAVWYPTALLPSQGVRWTAVDEHSADATLTDGPFTLSLRFRFDDNDLITSFRAESRGSMVGEVMVQAPWEGRFSNHALRDGMQVPLAGEVAWMRPAGRKTYFRGQITQLTYDFAP